MADKNRVICILGSGRCGTSAITRAINLLGVNIGSNFISFDKTNPKGFWEDKNIVEVHKRIFKEFAGPKQYFPPDWIKSEQAKQYKDILIEYLQQNLNHDIVWAWKDPRTCYTLELWKEIFTELNILPQYLIMVRNPIDVVSSYKNAYNISKNNALYQWKLRTLLALSKTYGEHRIMIDYDHLIDNSVKTLRKISSEFKLPWPQEDQFINNLNSFIDPNLQHSQSGMKKLMESNDYEEEIKKMYSLFYKASLSTSFLNSDEFNTKVNEYLKGIFRIKQ